jgi:hypothetical protein
MTECYLDDINLSSFFYNAIRYHNNELIIENIESLIKCDIFPRFIKKLIKRFGIKSMLSDYNLILFGILYIYYNPLEYTNKLEYLKSPVHNFSHEISPITQLLEISSASDTTYRLIDDYTKYSIKLYEKCDSINIERYCVNSYGDNNLRRCFYNGHICKNIDYSNNLDLKLYNKIDGLVNFFEWKIFDKHIYLLGEYHLHKLLPTRNKIVNCVDYILSLCNNQYSWTLYLEYNKFDVHTLKRDNLNNKGIIKLATILEYYIDNDIFNNITTISTELRSRHLTKLPFINKIYKLLDIYLETKKEYNSDYTELCNLIKNDFDLFFSVIVDETKIGNFFYKIDNPIMKYNIEKYFYTNIYDLFTTNKFENIFMLTSYINDFYTLCHIFSNKSKNIIVYNGSTHTYNINYFLQTLVDHENIVSVRSIESIDYISSILDL